MATDSFQAPSVEVKALCKVALLNRLVLDQLLVAQGGVRHIIGDTYCNYIPDISHNMTHVVSRLNAFLQRQKTSTPLNPGDLTCGPGWPHVDLWLPSGSWYSVLVLIMLNVFFVLFFGVNIYLRKMMTSAIDTSFMHLHTFFAAPKSDPFPDIDWNDVPLYSSDQSSESEVWSDLCHFYAVFIFS